MGHEGRPVKQAFRQHEKRRLPLPLEPGELSRLADEGLPLGPVAAESLAAFIREAENGQGDLTPICFLNRHVARLFQLGQVGGEISLG